MTFKRAFLIASSGLCAVVLAVLLMNVLPAPGASLMAQAKARSVASIQATSGARQSTAGTRDQVSTPIPVALSVTASTETSGDVATSNVPRSVSSGAGPNNGPVILPAADIDLDYLRGKNLLLPVAGVSANALRDSFNDARSEGRVHQALDIRAPEGTPVLATTDGKVKLHSSSRGGIMIYETDQSAPYVYYYGHLQRYAEGIYDGKPVSRGDVIAYVGDTGNAGPGNFHLHFGISRVATPGQWSGGEPINPYLLLSR
ncbi:MAG TPA: M23 family metallopeptidase [Blastocatellia bacterium]|nr:M23 family metallopeptidase [Blastocatellia bacterium]